MKVRPLYRQVAHLLVTYFDAFGVACLVEARSYFQALSGCCRTDQFNDYLMAY